MMISYNVFTTLISWKTTAKVFMSMQLSLYPPTDIILICRTPLWGTRFTAMQLYLYSSISFILRQGTPLWRIIHSAPSTLSGISWASAFNSSGNDASFETPSGDDSSTPLSDVTFIFVSFWAIGTSACFPDKANFGDHSRTSSMMFDTFFWYLD